MDKLHNVFDDIFEIENEGIFFNNYKHFNSLLLTFIK